MSKPWLNRALLETKYLNDGDSLPEIASEWDCSPQTVANALERFEIERRSISEARLGAGLSDDALAILTDRDSLADLYHGEFMSMKAIGRELDCNDQTVRNYMDRHEIPPREFGEGWRGENHPRYAGGETRHGRTWPKDRIQRLDYDNFGCVVCGLHDGEHVGIYGFGLHVHHIMRPEQFRGPDGSIDHERANRPENLITLCIACHNRWEGIPLRPTRID